MKYNILLAGVGGQGLMLLSAIIGRACVNSGLNVVTSEQHGLAQRSGSISAHIRIGDVYSPLISYGSADMIISMEAMESLRNVEYLKPDGYVITGSRILHPVIETSMLADHKKEKLEYVTLEQVLDHLENATKKITVLESDDLAKRAGNPRTENTVLLGAAVAVDEFPVSREAIMDALRSTVPERTIKVNLKAFELGSKQMKSSRAKTD